MFFCPGLGSEWQQENKTKGIGSEDVEENEREGNV